MLPLSRKKSTDDRQGPKEEDGKAVGGALTPRSRAAKISQLRQRTQELEDELRLERLKGLLPDATMSEGTMSPTMMSPTASHARALSHARLQNPNTFLLSSEVLVILEEERRVPTSLADLLKEASGREDRRESDTPRAGHQPPTGFPAGPAPPPDFPLDRIMTEKTLGIVNNQTSHIMALQAIPPTSLDAFNYVTETFDKDNNRFDHDVDTLYSIMVALVEETSPVLQRGAMYRPMKSPCYVFGDIHGNFSDLSYFLDNIVNFRDLHFTPANLLFLGDYVDRGPHGLECVMLLFSLILGYPNQVAMLRGNHEDPLVNGDIRHYGPSSFKAQCLRIFGERKGITVWDMVNEQCFRHLPLAGDIDGKIFCSHGGIPRFAGGADVRLSKLRDPSFPHLSRLALFDNAPPHEVMWTQLATDLTWSDPTELESTGTAIGNGFFLNSRGPGTIAFGTTAVDQFLQNNGFEYIFRAHQEKSDGLRLSKSARVITIFSTSDYEGHRNGAGMLFVSHTGEIRLVIKKDEH